MGTWTSSKFLIAAFLTSKYHGKHLLGQVSYTVVSPRYDSRALGFQNVVIAEHYDEFAKHMVGHTDWQTLMPYAEELLQDSGGFVRFHGLEAEVQRELAQQLFAMRHDVWRQYVTSIAFQRYLEARAFNEEYDRKQERRLAGEIQAALERDELVVRPELGQPAGPAALLADAGQPDRPALLAAEAGAGDAAAFSVSMVAAPANGCSEYISGSRTARQARGRPSLAVRRGGFSPRRR